MLSPLKYSLHRIDKLGGTKMMLHTDCPGAFDPFLEGYYSAVGRATGQVVVYSGRGRFKVFF